MHAGNFGTSGNTSVAGHVQNLRKFVQLLLVLVSPHWLTMVLHLSSCTVTGETPMNR